MPEEEGTKELEAQVRSATEQANGVGGNGEVMYGEFRKGEAHTREGELCEQCCEKALVPGSALVDKIDGRGVGELPARVGRG